MGRPTKFRPEFVIQAERLGKLGLTDEQLAGVFGVSVATLGTWKKTQPAFLEALKGGKDLADARVEAALFHRAIGYSHEAVKILTVAGKVRKVAYVEHYPPDPVACIFWLKNRQKASWRAEVEPDPPKDNGPDGLVVEEYED